jgi:hypothetical protein
MYFLVKNTKAIYFTNTLNDCENNPKKMWKTINKLTNKQSKQLLYPKSGTIIKIWLKKHKIADALNSHFNEVVYPAWLKTCHRTQGRLSHTYLYRPDTQFTIQNVTLTKVYKLLSTIKTSKSAGHDRILNFWEVLLN